MRVADDSVSGDIRMAISQYKDQRVRYAPNSRRLGAASLVAKNIATANGQHIAIPNDDNV